MVMMKKKNKRQQKKTKKPNFERARTQKTKAHGFCANKSISPGKAKATKKKCRKHTPIIIKIN
jgi:hypothetical protein